MADNYLEKHYDEVFGGAPKSVTGHPSFEYLLRRSVPVASFASDYRVHRLQLEAIARVLAVNGDSVFEPVLITDDAQIALLRGGIDACPENVGACIVLCSALPCGRDRDIDLGIAIQNMLLKAAQMGICGMVFREVGSVAASALRLPSTALAVIALGK